MTTQQLAYSVTEAARATGLSERTISRACKATDAKAAGLPLLASKRVGSKRLILATDLQQWLRDLQDA